MKFVLQTTEIRRHLIWPCLLYCMSVLFNPSQGKLQAFDDSAIRFVPESSSAALVIRPAMLIGGKIFQDIEEHSEGSATEMLRLVGDMVYKMSMVDITEIDEIVLAANPQTGNGDTEAFVVVIIRTVNDNARNFDLATNEMSVVEEVEGKTILSFPGKGVGWYRSAHIIDAKTIVWSYNSEGIKKVLRASKDGYKKTAWFNAWKPHSRQPVSFGFDSALFRNLEVPESYSVFRVFGGGAAFDTECAVDMNVLCPNEEDAITFLRVAGELTNLAKEKINEIDAKIDGWGFVQDSVSEILGNMQLRQEKNTVDVASSFSIDVKAVSLFIQTYVKTMWLAKDEEKRRKLGRAILNFEQAERRFPAPVMVVDGKKHSWRIKVLPYIGEINIYQNYRFDEEWNSPHNQRVTSRMPDVFRSEFAAKDTINSSWYLVYGETAVFQEEISSKLSDILDDPEQTIMAVEANLKHHWAEPMDLDVNERIFEKLGGFQTDGFFALFADGQSRFIADSVDRDVVRALMTSKGGESITKSDWQKKTQSDYEK